MSFGADDWVRCYNLADKKQIPLAMKALRKDLNKEQADEELNGTLADLKKEGLLKGRKACWVGYDDVGKPRGPGSIATMTIVSAIGSLYTSSRYYENSCEVFIRHKDGAVFTRPDNLY
jgi:hypothetical protein